MSDIRYKISDIRYKVSDIKYQISGVRYQCQMSLKVLEVTMAIMLASI